FGPMTLTSSPSATVSDRSSTAVTPPKRRVRPAMSISAITRCPLYGSQEPLRAEANEQQQRDAVDQIAVFGEPAEQLRQADQRDRAEDRAGDIAEAAEDHHGERQQRGLRREGLMVHIAVRVRQQGARDAGGEAGDAESKPLVAVERDAITARRHIVI